MSWTPTNLANYSESVGSTASKTSGTLSIPANSVVFVFAGGTGGSGAWPAAGGPTAGDIVVSDSVDGATGWTAIGNWLGSVSPGNGGAQLFYKKFTSSTSRAITVSRGGTNSVYWGYSVDAIVGADATTPVVQVQSAGTGWNDGGSAHSQAVTLGAAPTSGNLVLYWVTTNNDNAGQPTTPAGFTVLSHATPDLGAQFENTTVGYNSATTAPTITISDLGQSIETAVMFAAELALAGAGTTPVSATASTVVDATGPAAAAPRANVDATGPVAAVASSPVDAMLQLAVAPRANLDALAALAAIASAPYDALGAVSAIASSPWDATASTAPVTATVSVPWDATGPVTGTPRVNIDAALQFALTASSPYEAIATLAATASSPLDALAQLAAAPRANLDALAAAAAVASSPWDATGSSTIPVNAIATVFIDAIAQLAATASAPVDAMLQLALARSTAWEAQLGVAAAPRAVVDAPGGAGGPVQAWLDATGQLGVAVQANLDAQLQLQLAQSASWETQAGLGLTVTAVYEAPGGLLLVTRAPWEAAGLNPIPVLGSPLTLVAVRADTTLTTLTAVARLIAGDARARLNPRR